MSRVLVRIEVVLILKYSNRMVAPAQMFKVNKALSNHLVIRILELSNL
jgi:hypothetical protein